MKIDELIEELKKVKKQHGNLKINAETLYASGKEPVGGQLYDSGRKIKIRTN